MHKEAPMTKAQKEDIRAKNMYERDLWDQDNLGNFRRSYPHPDCVSTLTVTS